MFYLGVSAKWKCKHKCNPWLRVAMMQFVRKLHWASALMNHSSTSTKQKSWVVSACVSFFVNFYSIFNEHWAGQVGPKLYSFFLRKSGLIQSEGSWVKNWVCVDLGFLGSLKIVAESRKLKVSLSLASTFFDDIILGQGRSECVVWCGGPRDQHLNRKFQWKRTCAPRSTFKLGARIVLPLEAPRPSDENHNVPVCQSETKQHQIIFSAKTTVLQTQNNVYILSSVPVCPFRQCFAWTTCFANRNPNFSLFPPEAPRPRDGNHKGPLGQGEI